MRFIWFCSLNRPDHQSARPASNAGQGRARAGAMPCARPVAHRVVHRGGENRSAARPRATLNFHIAPRLQKEMLNRARGLADTRGAHQELARPATHCTMPGSARLLRRRLSTPRSSHPVDKRGRASAASGDDTWSSSIPSLRWLFHFTKTRATSCEVSYVRSISIRSQES